METGFKLLDWAKTNWNKIVKLRWVLAVACLFIGGFEWFGFRLYYAQLIETKDERIKLKEETVAYYRERYAMLPPTNHFASLRSRELKDKALALVQKLRNLQERMRLLEISIIPDALEKKPITQEIWEKYLPLRTEFVEKYRADSNLILEELLTRTPKEKHPPINKESFQMITVALNIPDICDPIEKMALELPTGD